MMDSSSNIRSLVLKVWDSDFGAPSVQPICIELMTLLKFNGLNYEISKPNFYRWNGGGVPVLVDNQQSISNVDSIRQTIHKLSNSRVDTKLDSVNLGRLRAYSEYFKSSFGMAFYFERWLNDLNYVNVIKPCLGSSVIFPLNTIYLRGKRERAADYLLMLADREDPERFKEELSNQASTCLDDLENLLSDGRPFLLGKFPTSLDALVYSHLVLALNMPLLTSTLKTNLQNHSVLVRYVKKITNEYFPNTPAPSKKFKPAEPNNSNLDSASPGTIFIAGFCATVAMMMYAVSIGLLNVAE